MNPFVRIILILTFAALLSFVPSVAMFCMQDAYRVSAWISVPEAIITLMVLYLGIFTLAMRRFC